MSDEKDQPGKVLRLKPRPAQPKFPVQHRQGSAPAAKLAEFPPRGAVGHFRAWAEGDSVVFSMAAEWVGEKPVEFKTTPEAALKIAQRLSDEATKALRARGRKGEGR